MERKSRRGRKRKLSEKCYDKSITTSNSIVILDDGTTIEVKSEHDGDVHPVAPPIVFVSCCCLCKVPSESPRLRALFDIVDPEAVKKIQNCFGVEISPEVQPVTRICRACRQELDIQHGNWKRWLQCNEFAQNQIPVAGATAGEAEIQVCRFCLKIGEKLLDLFRDLDEDQLNKIRQGIDIEITALDAVKKMCFKCIERIDEFLDFRKNYLPVPEKTEQDNKPAPVCKVEEEANLEEVVNVEDVQQNSIVVELDDSDSVISLDESSRPSTSVDDGNQLDAADSDSSKLPSSDSNGRNFTVTTDADDQLKVEFEGYMYRLLAELPSGASQWLCAQAKLRICRVKLEINSESTSARIINPTHNHCHSTAPPKVLECPAGRSTVNFEGKKEQFVLIHGKQEVRSLLIGGFRYFLNAVKNRTEDSIWQCSTGFGAKCKAGLDVEGIFHKITAKESHNHEPLSEHYVNLAAYKADVDVESTEAIDAFRRANPPEALAALATETRVKLEKEKERKLSIKRKRGRWPTEEMCNEVLTKEKDPEIFKLLEEEDPERNFQTSKAGVRFKLSQNGFECRYFARTQDGSTVWKCIFDTLHHCLIVKKLSADGKKLETTCGVRHNHTAEPAAIFTYPLGKRMVGEEPLWLLSRVSLYYENRCLIYRDYVFVLQEVSQRKGVVRFSCLQKHKCRALLNVKGDFEEVVAQKEHTHDKPSPEVLKSMIEGKSSLDPVSEDLPFKKKLLSQPSTKGRIWGEDRNEFETFYILNAICPGKKTSYVVIFRGYRYIFASVDQNGTSRWICQRNDSRRDNCKALAIVEGLFESISLKSEHNHEKLLESELEHMIKRCVTDLQSTEKGVSCLNELPSGANESNNILSMLARNDPERNFSVERSKLKLLITYEGNIYRLKSHEEDGSSLWCCSWSRLRQCPAMIRISPDTKHASPEDVTKQHNHSDEQIGVYLADSGKGFTYDTNRNDYMPYYLYSYQSDLITNRAIIYQGNRYHLYKISNNGRSRWLCRRSCRAFVHVEDVFKTISIKTNHNHEPLSKEEIKSYTGLSKFDEGLLSDASKTSPAIEALLGPSAVLSVLSKPDPDRNFEFSSYKEQMKIHRSGYDYYYFGTSTENTHSLWKCVYSDIRNCGATARMDHQCKVVSLYQSPKHTHAQQQWKLFSHPSDQSTILETHTKTIKPIWFLVRPSFRRPQASIVYEGNKFALSFISESGHTSKWICVAPRCPTIVKVTGQLEAIASGGAEPHNHPLPSEETRTGWLRLDGDGSSTDDGDADGISTSEDDADKEEEEEEQDESDDDHRIPFKTVKMEFGESSIM